MSKNIAFANLFLQVAAQMQGENKIVVQTYVLHLRKSATKRTFVPAKVAAQGRGKKRK